MIFLFIKFVPLSNINRPRSKSQCQEVVPQLWREVVTKEEEQPVSLVWESDYILVILVIFCFFCWLEKRWRSRKNNICHWFETITINTIIWNYVVLFILLYHYELKLNLCTLEFDILLDFQYNDSHGQFLIVFILPKHKIDETSRKTWWNCAGLFLKSTRQRYDPRSESFRFSENNLALSS